MAESCRAQQLEEVECMLSMFPSAEELEESDALRNELEVSSAISFGGAGDAPPSSPPPPVRYSLHFKDQRVIDDEVPSLELAYPPAYPLSAVTFSVHCSALTRAEKEAINDELSALATSAASTGDVVVLEMYQHMSAFLSAARDRHLQDATSCGLSDDLQRQLDLAEKPQPRDPTASGAEQVLGRRAIYFHHIIAPTKRRVVVEWALELQLSGFSKIGWPGVVIVEGEEADVQEYVRRLQHLRWKQMVVRGEQTERGGATRSVEKMRKLPRGFREFPEKGGMAALAAACRDAGVEQLFLTTMKIYGRGEAHAGDADEGATSRGKEGRHSSRGRDKR